MPYGHTITLDLSFRYAVSKVKDAFGAQGFGTLTEIDVQATLKQKLGQASDPYVILGTCNPSSPTRPSRSSRRSGCCPATWSCAATPARPSCTPWISRSWSRSPNDPNSSPSPTRRTSAFAPPSTASTRKTPNSVCSQAAHHAGCTTASSASAV